MFDLSLAELLLIVVVIVVFIQPKDIPVVVRAIARAIATLRGYINEMKAAFEDIAKESGVADVRETLEAEMRMIEGDDGQMYESYHIKKPELKKPNDPAT
jgi:Tat protein translocase TatB subunit